MVLWLHVMLCGNTLLRVQLASLLHSQQCIPTQHDMLPQHHVYRNELNWECYNFSKVKHSSLMMI